MRKKKFSFGQPMDRDRVPVFFPKVSVLAYVKGAAYYPSERRLNVTVDPALAITPAYRRRLKKSKYVFRFFETGEGITPIATPFTVEFPYDNIKVTVRSNASLYYATNSGEHYILSLCTYSTTLGGRYTIAYNDDSVLVYTTKPDWTALELLPKADLWEKALRDVGL